MKDFDRQFKGQIETVLAKHKKYYDGRRKRLALIGLYQALMAVQNGISSIEIKRSFHTTCIFDMLRSGPNVDTMANQFRLDITDIGQENLLEAMPTLVEVMERKGTIILQ